MIQIGLSLFTSPKVDLFHTGSHSVDTMIITLSLEVLAWVATIKVASIGKILTYLQTRGALNPPLSMLISIL